MDKKQKEPGQYMGAGIAIGSGLGVALGTALGNIAVGISLGIGVGVAIGAALEKQAKEDGTMRTLSPEEKESCGKKSRVALIAALVVFAVVVLTYFFLK